MNHRHSEGKGFEEIEVGRQVLPGPGESITSPYLRGPNFPEKDWAFFIRVLEERKRQDARWGGPSHDDEHIYSDWLTFIKDQLYSVAYLPGTPEQLDAAMLDGTNLIDYEYRMVKVAALAMAAAQSARRKVEATLRQGVV